MRKVLHFVFLRFARWLFSIQPLPVGPHRKESIWYEQKEQEQRASLVIVFTESDLERNHFRYLMSFWFELFLAPVQGSLNAIFMCFRSFSIPTRFRACLCRSHFFLNYISSCIMNAELRREILAVNGINCSSFDSEISINCFQIFAK